MDSNFLHGLEVSSTSDSEDEVRKPTIKDKWSKGDSNSNVKEIGSIRILEQATRASTGHKSSRDGSSRNVEGVSVACLHL